MDINDGSSVIIIELFIPHMKMHVILKSIVRNSAQKYKMLHVKQYNTPVIEQHEMHYFIF
jgi:hypothetical protein